MECIVIFGPSAVGKFTVGRELCLRMEFRLFHNHMVIDLVRNFFSWSDKGFWNLVGDLRERIFQELRLSETKGVVFTYVWALNRPEDHEELLKYLRALGVPLDEVFFVELCADQSVRLSRNREESRLVEKRTKRNIAESEQFIFESEKKYVLNSNNDFLYPDRHLKIDNTNLSAIDTAGLILKELEERHSPQRRRRLGPQ